MSRPVSIARQAAYRALVAVAAGKYANLALKEVLSGGEVSARDAQLATALVLGVLEKQLLLDYMLDTLLKNPSSIPANLRINLRMAAYQLLYMDRIPDAAAISDAVELARDQGFSGLCPLVNGTLRNLARQRGRIALPSRAEDPVAHLSVAASTPKWLVERLVADHGFEEAERLLAYADQTRTCLRYNRLKITLEELESYARSRGWDVRASGLWPDILFALSTGDIAGDPFWRAGKFSVQGAASQLSVRALDPAAGQKLLDVCAAPGGKSAAMAELSGDSARIVSCDIHTHRLKLIDANARRLGLRSIQSHLRDASAPPPQDWLDAFDGVLCDVPCSGLGLMSFGKPEIRYRLMPQTLGALPALQSRILAQSARCVAPGGALVYSTCTVLRAENAAVVAEFLEENRDFLPDTQGLWLPEPLRGRVGPEGGILLLPHVDGVEGFYIARLVRSARA